MAVGDTWRSQSHYTVELTTTDPIQGKSEDTLEGTVTLRREVLRVEDVEVPAGTFECFVIRDESDREEGSDLEGAAYTLIWFNQTLSTVVKEISYDDDGDVMATEVMVDFDEGDGEPVTPGDGEDGEDGSDGKSSGGDADYTLTIMVIGICIMAGLLALAIHSRRSRRQREARYAERSGPRTRHGAAAGGARPQDLLTCPNCGQDFDPGDGGTGAGGMSVKCPHCGIEGRLG
jgi:hypothetical protein